MKNVLIDALKDEMEYQEYREECSNCKYVNVIYPPMPAPTPTPMEPSQPTYDCGFNAIGDIKKISGHAVCKKHTPQVSQASPVTDYTPL